MNNLRLEATLHVYVWMFSVVVCLYGALYSDHPYLAVCAEVLSLVIMMLHAPITKWRVKNGYVIFPR